jgi:hypothetical protein
VRAAAAGGTGDRDKADETGETEPLHAATYMPLHPAPP